MRSLRSLLAVAFVLSACGGGQKAREPLPKAASAIRLSSTAFAPGGSLPTRYTCDGESVAPPLAWSGVPRRARRLVLVVEDPDADHFVHWTVLNIPATQTHLDARSMPRGAVETDNSFGKRGWGAPCPPRGDAPHRYVFAVYATDAALTLDQRSSPDDVRRQLASHALARGLLTARFGRD